MIGEKLSDLLALKKIKPGTLASATGLSKSTIYSIIKRNNKNVDNSIMEKIADYLGVPVEYFYDRPAPGDNSDPIVTVFSDEFTYAAHNYSGKLRPEDKQTIMKMMAALAAANEGADKDGSSH